MYPTISLSWILFNQDHICTMKGNIYNRYTNNERYKEKFGLGIVRRSQVLGRVLGSWGPRLFITLRCIKFCLLVFVSWLLKIKWDQMKCKIYHIYTKSELYIEDLNLGLLWGSQVGSWNRVQINHNNMVKMIKTI